MEEQAALRSCGRCSRCSEEAGEGGNNRFTSFKQMYDLNLEIEIYLELAGLDVSQDGRAIAACLADTGNIRLGKKYSQIKSSGSEISWPLEIFPSKQELLKRPTVVFSESFFIIFLKVNPLEKG